MKFLIIVIICCIGIPCEAQWVTLNVNGEVEGFGSHDTSFFISGGNELARIGPNSWVAADSGLDETQGPMTTFVSLGSNFFAGSLRFLLGSAWGAGAMSTNDGTSWKWAGAGGPVGTNGTYLFGELGTYPNGDSSIIARSRDSGKTWERRYYPAGLSYAGTGAIVYANTLNYGILRSMDSGYTWYHLVTPFSGNILMVGTLLFVYQPFDPTNIANGHNGILIMSQDSGIHWDTVRVDSAGTPEFVNALVTDGKDLFAGGYNAVIPRTHDYWTTGNGFYVSTDTGKHWHVANDGLGIIIMEAIGYFPYDSMVYVSTEYNHQFPWATYSRPLRELIDTSKSAVREISALPNDSIMIYPNPSSGTVTIRSGGTSILGVQVLNVLGETMLNEPAPRESDMTLDLSRLPSGTYFVRIEAAGGVVMRKFIRE